MLEREDVVAYLLERGVLESRVAVDGEVRVLDASRRNRNFHVLPTDAAGVVVKQDSGADRTVGTVRYEAVVLELLAGLAAFGEVRDRMPRSLGFDPRAGALLVEFVADGENLRQHHQRLGRTPLAVAARIGETLGLLHTSGRRALHEGRLGGLSCELPDAMELTLPPLRMVHATSAGMEALITALQNLDGVAGPMAQLVAEWREETLVHGDPRWDNWVVAGDGDIVVLVDWEFARVGDPAWDVGGVLGDYLGAWVLGTPELPGVPLAAGAALSAFPLAELQEAMRALWEGYLRRAVLADAHDELLRVVRCAAARLVELSGEQMFRASDLDASTGALVQLAANVFADPARAAGELLGLSVPTRVRSS